MSDIFDPAYDDNPTIQARADQDDAYLYDTNQPPQWLSLIHISEPTRPY